MSSHATNLNNPSFKFDHTKVVAPYVRLADCKSFGNASVVKYDIRLKQPNGGTYLTQPGAHALEHCLSETMRDLFGNQFIDCSVMMCMTGVYLTICDHPVNINSHVKKILEAFRLVSKFVVCPGSSEFSCGNYKTLDLAQAKVYAKEFVSQIEVVGTTGYKYPGYKEVSEILN